MSCCNACAENERRAIIGGGTTGDLPPGSTAGPAGDVYTGPPLTPEQICRARIYSSREHASGYAARDQRDCLERAAADIAAGRNGGAAPRMPTGNIWNARERGSAFRQRRSTQDRAPMPGREPAAKPAAKPAPAPAARPAVPRPGGTPKGGASPTQRGASPFRPATPTPNRATLMNARQVRTAMAAIPKATQFQMRQAAQAAQAAAYPPAPPGYEWAPAGAPEYGYAAPPGEYAPPGYEYAYAPPPEAASDGGDIGALLDELLTSEDPADVDLAGLVIAELTGSTVAGVNVGSGPVTNPTVRAIDDVISSLWGGLRGIVPGGDAIDVVHQTRRELMYGPEGRTDRGRTSPGGPGGRLPAASSPILPARTDAEGRIATVGPTTSTASTIAELQRLVRAAARGGSSSSAARDLRALKTAARVSPEARRRWVASVAVMRDDLARIRAAAR